VAARLTEDGVLVEILWMRPFNFQAKGAAPRRGEPRYLALILYPNQHIDYVDLGLAEPIDQAVGTFLLAARNPNKDPLPSAQAVYQVVFAPLIPKLREVKKLYLSLDGSLNLVPFAALHDGQRYLLDSPYQLVYLTSGRDLLRGSLGQPAQPPLVLADPDYGRSLSVAASGHLRTLNTQTRDLYEATSTLLRLPGARREGVLLGTLLGVRPLLGAAATEAAVRQVRAPSILHFATHGLYVGEESAHGRSLAQMQSPKSPGAIGPLVGRSQDLSLSRSALALAGAAHADQANDAAHDGLLTGEEARSLNLFGTQLVVLSACDTGRGTVKAGQGVYGLRRAFFVAGAETVVMSLWPVSDYGTKSLMFKYYRLLLNKGQPGTRVSGLWEAMKSVKAEHPHPYYWAPFMAVGSDAPLTLSAKQSGGMAATQRQRL
jgi:CHAT domain-containing protein